MGLQEALFNLFLAVVTGLLSVITSKVTLYFKEKGLLDQLKAKQKSVDIAVNAVEQIYYQENGPERFKHAQNRARELLAKQGINISEQELETLIEASVGAMKQASNFLD